LLALLKRPNLQRVRFCVAYARWEGIGLISDALDEFIKNGGRFECIFGAGNGVTTPDALYYGLVLEKLYPGRTWSGYVEDQYENASFHPKYFEFRFDTETVVLVGSANLSGGGLSRNGEVGFAVTVPHGDPAEQDLKSYWDEVRASAKKVTAADVTALSKKPGTSRERDAEEGGKKSGKPFLAQKSKAAAKPLFRKILGLKNLKQGAKDALLGDLTELTDRPENLYIQIFPRETGGNHGQPGAAVQFPVATLGTFFGVGTSENRKVRIEFPGETVEPTFMHLSNNTHRLRLTPIFTVKRPAVLHLKRIGPDRYRARFIPTSQYATVLASKCNRQSRAGSRKWGMS
jgi:HKD family nuclease